MSKVRAVLVTLIAALAAIVPTVVGQKPAEAQATTTLPFAMNVMVSQWNGAGWQGICSYPQIYTPGNPNPVNTGWQPCTPRPPSQGFAPLFTMSVSGYWHAPVASNYSVNAWCLTTDPATYPACVSGGATYIPLNIYGRNDRSASSRDGAAGSPPAWW